MAGENVYDVARQWCHVCGEDHPDCEPDDPDLRFTCLGCFKPIEFDEEAETGGDYHAACGPKRAT